jgi:SAM-dependent methyltransferase
MIPSALALAAILLAAEDAPAAQAAPPAASAQPTAAVASEATAPPGTPTSATPAAGATPPATPQPVAPPRRRYRSYAEREGGQGHLPYWRPAPGQPAAAASPAPRGGHGNPWDLAAYGAALLDPSRDAWQKPDQVVAALGLAPGQVACDVGSGPGYFTLRLARAVGPGGRVYAVDVEPALLAALRDRLGPAGARQVTPVLSLADDPLLPAAGCDVVLLVDTYHHLADGPAYLRRLAAALRPGGRIVNVDFHARETPVGPPVAERVTREAFLVEASSGGLALEREESFLPHQYLLVLRPAAAGSTPGPAAAPAPAPQAPPAR